MSEEKMEAGGAGPFVGGEEMEAKRSLRVSGRWADLGAAGGWRPLTTRDMAGQGNAVETETSGTTERDEEARRGRQRVMAVSQLRIESLCHMRWR